MRCPRTADQWKAVGDQLGSRWNFVNTVGALDEKQIAIKCPSNSEWLILLSLQRFLFNYPVDTGGC
ncbi:hypothetical protein HOLleu_21097 [Holothuria leucospilota]|uniref:Uncharacterized protein n=1 Tax=Holothuria leucospilota TaxID=206669 RepID=A0A9Q1BXB1_HOLLE|nr:hypothetical protein HOLleu_21097 [Holothuria leucospilota]